MIRFTVAPGRLTDIGSCVLASCSRSGHGHTRGRARGPRPHKTGSPRPPLRRPRARPAHVTAHARHTSAAGARGARGRGAEPSLDPSSLETLGCGERGGAATKLTQMRTGTRGGNRHARRAASGGRHGPPRGRDGSACSARRPRRSCHTRALTSHRPHRSELAHVVAM
jgi:hypothetical protein